MSNNKRMIFNAHMYNKLAYNYKIKKTDKELNELRNYLDCCGYRMPLPQYKYDQKDKSTWKYLQSHYRYNELKTTWSCKQIMNPMYIYQENFMKKCEYKKDMKKMEKKIEKKDKKEDNKMYVKKPKKKQFY